jgi:structural maintenance of chromosome 1
MSKKGKNTVGQRLQQVQTEIDSLAPNLRAMDKLDGAEVRLRHAMESFEKQRTDAKKARDSFLRVKQRRYELFSPCFKHISESIDTIYKALTRDSQSGQEGTAYLSLEDSEEPYLEGIRFHAMPPGKRFLDMESLSGGERTMAALALLFSLHSFLPAPFFILDEVDAALDNANVTRLASYLRNMSHSSPTKTQLLVISLKPTLYEQSDALVGVYRNGLQSKPLTLRLTDYDNHANIPNTDKAPHEAIDENVLQNAI